MAILTWKDVAIPHTDAAQQGIRTAGAMLSRAVDHTDNALGVVKATDTDAANRAILGRALAVRDPAQYAQQMAAGQIVGADAGNASIDLLKFAEGRQDSLRQRADTDYKSNRSQMIDGQNDAASEVFGQAVEAVKAGDRTKANALMAQQALDLGTRTNAAKTLDTLEDDPNAMLSRFRFTQEQENQAILKKSLGNMREYQSFGDNTDAKAKLMQGIKDDREYQMTQQLLDQSGEGVSQEITGSKASMGASVSPNAKYGLQNAMDTRYNGLTQVLHQKAARGEIPPPPSPNATYGEIYDYDRKHVIGVSAARGDAKNAEGKARGTSALGPFQFVSKTRAAVAKDLWGDDWRNKQRTYENEQQLAEHHYNNLRKNKNWQAGSEWEAYEKNYPTFNEPGYFKDKPWDKVAPLKGYIESGYMPDNHLNTTAHFQSYMETKLGNLSTGAKVIRNSKTLAGQTGAEVAKTVASAIGSDSEREVNDVIRNTLNRARAKGVKISEAEVGGLLMNSLEQDSWISSISDFNSDTAIMDKVLDQFAAEHGSAGMQLQEFEQEELALKKINELDQKFVSAQQHALSQLRKAKTQPNARDAAIDAFDNWQQISDAKGKLLGKAEAERQRLETEKGALKAKEVQKIVDASAKEDKRGKSTVVDGYLSFINKLPF